MTERFAIVAFNPDGTEDFLDFDDDFDKLWLLKNKYQRKERKDWIKQGGEYVVVEMHRTTLQRRDSLHSKRTEGK